MVQYARNFNKLIVNYIPSTFTRDDMYKLFSPMGRIKCCKLIMEDTRNLGYGFVQYDNPYNALIAIKKLNGLHVHDKILRVDYPYFSRRGKLLVRNLRRDVSENQILQVFGRFGQINSIKILRDNVAPKMYGLKHNQGMATGRVFILYVTAADAVKAYIHLNDTLTINDNDPLEIILM